jgi:hypothetical protein
MPQPEGRNKGVVISTIAKTFNPLGQIFSGLHVPRGMAVARGFGRIERGLFQTWGLAGSEAIWKGAATV